MSSKHGETISKGNVREFQSGFVDLRAPGEADEVSSASSVGSSGYHQSPDTESRKIHKAGVSVRVRSEDPIVFDGCLWGNYMPKAVWGPIYYYRCSMAIDCPVHKQVQQCEKDKSVFIITYEGNHNHSLPPAALSIASYTMAASKMLLSGLLTSHDLVIYPTNTNVGTVTLDLTRLRPLPHVSSFPGLHSSDGYSSTMFYQPPVVAATMSKHSGEEIEKKQ